jgi:DNA-binding XRE family transcriptional regulator
MSLSCTPTPLKQILLAEGRKQSWLAKTVGIDQATLSRIVNGLHCDEPTRVAISAALGRPAREVFPESERLAA